MDIFGKIKAWKEYYVIMQVKKINLPPFPSTERKRYRIIFRGRVQKVGFRLTVLELAKRLHLTGFCKNLETGEVLAELQGENNRIAYLVSYMESLKRIKIKDKIVQELELNRSETGFVKQ